MTRASVLAVLNAVMRRNPSALSEEVVMGMGALKPLINMFRCDGRGGMEGSGFIMLSSEAEHSW